MKAFMAGRDPLIPRSLEEDNERPRPDQRHPGGLFQVHQMFASPSRARLAAGIVSALVLVGCGAATAVFYAADNKDHYSIYDDLANFFGGQ